MSLRPQKTMFVIAAELGGGKLCRKARALLIGRERPTFVGEKSVTFIAGLRIVNSDMDKPYRANWCLCLTGRKIAAIDAHVSDTSRVHVRYRAILNLHW